VEVVKSELHSSSPVSSSRIREALLVGEIEEVNKMLGRQYTVSASVQTGKGMGREFGFPTINLPWSPESKPAYGVYVGQLRRDGEEDKYAIANYGLRPTVEEGSTEPLLEVHVLDSIQEDFASSGVSLSMTLKAFLRPEKKFDSVDDLRIQIKKDILKAEELRGQN
jgi:riboflavin kinase/FMN adenylyltransferase